MISDFVYELCHSPDTVTSVVASDTSVAPGEVAKKLFSKRELPRSNGEERKDHNLERAYECGKWGNTRPSDLFLKVSLTLDSKVSYSVCEVILIAIDL